ncbi:HEPN domain-containing protein [Aliamphritea hakodatensis]|uniref:HEPN domain-containing protein n=1 Tax=Aliamphritea hakodatensis TaxID=2895352 RepID=UPI0022FD76BE|nr:HEPN domain-containing protein [Aliamphritea hakodatensis]
MCEYGLKEAIDENMPFIDELLQRSNVPIFYRFIRAAKIFVDEVVVDCNLESKDELLKSKAFVDGIVPLVNNWYRNKYGDLAGDIKDRSYSGIIIPYGHPVLVDIPATTSRVEVRNETAWLTFPDSLQETESMSDMVQTKSGLNSLSKKEMDKLSSEFEEVVYLTRSINLNIMAMTGFDQETSNMAKGIWSHFEKSIADILSFKTQQLSIGCWELHLAIEKALKVYLKQISGSRPFGHDLIKLCDRIREHDPSLDLSLVQLLPTDKRAIRLRYSELIINQSEVLHYYKIALLLVSKLTDKYTKKYKFNNASFLIKVSLLKG